MKKTLQILPFLILMCFTLSFFTVQGADIKAEETLTLKVKNTDNGISLSWNGSKKDSYSVYKKTGKGKYVKITTVEGKKYTDKKVLSGKKYSYCIKKSPQVKSRHIAITYLDSPQIKKAVNTDTGISLSWDAISGADKYIVYRRTKNGKFKKIGSTKILSYTDSMAKKNVKYYYTLKAYKNKSYSATKKEVSAVNISNPELTSVKKQNGSLLVSWKKTENAEKYTVYRRLSDEKKWQKLTTVSSDVTSYKDTDVKPNKSYSYYIKASAGKCRSINTGVYLTQTYISVPNGLILKQNRTKITLTWKKTDGATGYEIYRKIADGKWQKHKILTSADITFEETLKSAKKNVSYKIRAVTDKGKSAFSSIVSIRYIDPKKPMVALTYDDGPHPVHTHTILDVLEKYDARATFFVVGSRVSEFSDCLIRANSLGCEIGNHSYSHASLSSNPDKTVLKEISRTDKLIKKYSGQTCAIARAPGGSIGKALKLIDKPFIQWSVDTRDWESRSSSKVISHIKHSVRDGSIILMHDLYGSTADATKKIIPWLIEEGYQLVTISELLDAKGIKKKSGKIYYNGY